MKQQLFSATLDNGIVVLGEQLPGLESAAIAFHVPSGAIADGPGRCGLATLAGEMMLRGAGDRNSREVVESLEGAGVQWAHSVSTSHASFAGAMVARQLVPALPIYADIIRRPRLPEDELEPARQMVLRNLAGTEDDPAHRAMAALRQLHYPTPWGMPAEGLSTEVATLGLDDVRAFVAERVVPRGTIIAVAGRLEWSEVFERIAALFGDWKTVGGAPPTTAKENVSAVFSSAADSVPTTVLLRPGCGGYVRFDSVMSVGGTLPAQNRRGMRSVRTKKHDTHTHTQRSLITTALLNTAPALSRVCSVTCRLLPRTAAEAKRSSLLTT